MKILLLSDTHGYLDDKMLKHIHWADEVWHAGDIGNLNVTDAIAAVKPLRAVYGNIDDYKTRLQFPEDQKFELEGKKVWMTHIGGYPGRYETRIKKELSLHPVDIFISGHSHILKVVFDKKNNLLHLNPGAAGIYGFHKVRTMLRFQLSKGEIKALEIVEIMR